MKDNYGLLIASLVAIVAIVGLVILFSGANSGAATSEVWHPDKVMRPCSGQAVGSACMTHFSQPGRCQASGGLWGDSICGVDVGCFCQFQR